VLPFAVNKDVQQCSICDLTTFEVRCYYVVKFKVSKRSN